MTAQYGKNHLGDLDEMLPTNHGFDEFLGNLYHLNAEQEPEHPDYPKDPEFKKQFGPRGVIKSTSDGKIEDTGPLTIKRMETIDDEVTAGALDFLERAKTGGQAVLPVVELHPHAHLDASQAGVTRQDRSGSLPGRHGGTRCAGWPDSRQAQRTGARRKHHRDVFHRQRGRVLLVAGRREHAVSQREKLELGRRLSRSLPDPVAWRDQTGDDLQ